MVAEIRPKTEVPTPASYGGPFRWSVERYLKAVETGVFRPEDRVELLEGEIVSKMPQNPPHVAGILLLTEAMRAVFGEGCLVNAQIPFTTPDSAPEPDIVVLRGAARDFATKLPSPEQIVLLAEVSNTSLQTDRGRKLGIYARAGIAEYWILNVADRQLEIHRRPLATGVYADSHIHGEDATVQIEGRELRVADLLP